MRRLRRLRHDAPLLLSGAVIVGIALAALAAPLLTSADPMQVRPRDQFLPPGAGGLLGTDEYGRDILARLLYGGRVTLAVSVVGVTAAVVLGMTMGMLAAYLGNPVDMLLMRLSDAILCFPPILLAIFVVSFVGPSLLNVTAVIAILYTPKFARIAYGSTLSVIQNEYIEAAKALGAPFYRILLVGIVPNIMGPVLVQASLGMGHAILLESGLSFLGLGPSPDLPSWGRMVQQSSRFMNLSPYGVLWPSLVIASAIVSFNLLGDALRDRLDPRTARRVSVEPAAQP